MRTEVIDFLNSRLLDLDKIRAMDDDSLGEVLNDLFDFGDNVGRIIGAADEAERIACRDANDFPTMSW